MPVGTPPHEGADSGARAFALSLLAAVTVHVVLASLITARLSVPQEIGNGALPLRLTLQGDGTANPAAVDVPHRSSPQDAGNPEGVSRGSRAPVPEGRAVPHTGPAVSGPRAHTQARPTRAAAAPPKRVVRRTSDGGRGARHDRPHQSSPRRHTHRSASRIRHEPAGERAAGTTMTGTPHRRDGEQARSGTTSPRRSGNTTDRHIVRISGREPAYPARARRRGIEGDVEIEIALDRTGAVVDVLILDARPPGVFERSVRRAVAGWRFQVPTDEGPLRLRETIRFRLASR